MNRNAVAFLALIVFLTLVALVGWIYALNTRLDKLAGQVDDFSSRLQAIESRFPPSRSAPKVSSRGKRPTVRRPLQPKRPKPAVKAPPVVKRAKPNTGAKKPKPTPTPKQK